MSFDAARTSARATISVGWFYGSGRGISVVDRMRFLEFESHFAATAIAATAAFLAQMIAARIFGAAHADTSRFFFTDTANEWHSYGH